VIKFVMTVNAIVLSF